MADIKVLETPTMRLKQEIDESVGKVLTEVNKMFEDGQITGITVLMTTTDEETHSCWSKQADSHMMIAALTRALVRMVRD